MPGARRRDLVTGLAAALLAAVLLALSLAGPRVLGTSLTAVPPVSGDGSPLRDPVPDELAFHPVPDPAGTDPAVEYAPAVPPPRARTIGVATFNIDKELSKPERERDARRLTSRPDVDIVGWQETNHSENVLTALPGWSTRFFDERGHIWGLDAVEVAVSWRSSAFSLVSSSRYLVHRGHEKGTTFPFPHRWISRVTLRERATGHLVTVLNTHLNHRIESYLPGRRGTWNDSLNARYAKTHLATLARMWDRVPGRYVVGTGDFNLSAGPEMRQRPAGGPTRAFAGRAVSNWAALGTAGQPLTAPDRDGDIDYVFAGARGVRRQWFAFASQQVLAGYLSDHRPLLVRLTLR